LDHDWAAPPLAGMETVTALLAAGIFWVISRIIP